jgi:uncharacterized membrane protein
LLGHDALHKFDANAYWRPSFTPVHGISRRINGQTSQTDGNRAIGAPQCRHKQKFRRKTVQLTPTIAVHMSLALSAVAIGPWVFWTRMGATTRPQLHRALGYAWVTCMLGAALTGLFIRDFRLPNLWGYTPIHLLIPLTLFSLYRAFRYLAAGNIPGHRKTMQQLYFWACIVTGIFTLLPGRYLGGLVWGQWLGWI